MRLDEVKVLASAQGTRVVHRMLESYTRPITAGTPWENPHRAALSADGQRLSILAYVATMRADATALDRCGDLRGETLGCWCAPRLCHGDVLSTLAAVDTVEERAEVLDAWMRELGGVLSTPQLTVL